MTVFCKASEALVFWKLARAHRAACIAFGAHSVQAIEIREDMSIIADLTDWPTLHERAQAVVDTATLQKRASG